MGKSQQPKQPKLMTYAKEEGVTETSHTFADNTERHADDQLLRSFGYKIYSRRRGHQSIWTDIHGDFYSHNEAMTQVRERIKRVEK